MAVYEQGSADDRYWMIDFMWTDPRTGKERRVRRVAKDKQGRRAKSRTAAEQHELRERAKLATEADAPIASAASDVPTLLAYKATYFADARVRLKPQTVDNYERTFERTFESELLMPELKSMPLDAIDETVFASLTRALHGRGLGAKTINNTLSVLHTVLAHAVETKTIKHAPAVRWQKTKPTTFDFFTFEETDRLLPKAVPFVVVALRTGMRIGELLELKWSDLSLERRTVTVTRSVWWDKKTGKRVVGSPKNHKPRTIPLADEAHAALEGMPARQGYVFCDSTGLSLMPTQLKWPIWRSQDAAGLRRTGPHVFRHTFASQLVMRGVPLPAVQALMGHSTIQMTMKYAHLAPDHLRLAIDAFRAPAP